MKNLNPNSILFFFLFAALLQFSHISNGESKCVKRNFDYPTPGKPVFSGSHPKGEHSSSSSSSTFTEVNVSSLLPSSSSSSSSASGSEAVDSRDGGSAELDSKFGGMLKSVVGQIDTNTNTNSPILNIPKATVSDPDIKKMCGATDFPDLCESTVAHFADGRHDPLAMLDFVIKACVQYTQLAAATAKKISKSPTFTKIKARFKDIADYYADALENLQDAENAIKARDIATVNINLSAALDDFGAYEDDWGETSPMSDFNTKLTHMASNCLAVATLVKFH